jgi:hypothetical protein
MDFSDFLKVGKQIAASAVKIAVVDFDEYKNNIILKRWIIERVAIKALEKRNIGNIERVFIDSNGVCIEHSVIGIIAVLPRKIVLSNAETIICFDSTLVYDRQKEKMNNIMLAGTIGAVAGGVLEFMTFGFLGGGIKMQSEMEMAKAAINYTNKERITGLGRNQILTMPPLSVLDPRTIIQDAINENGGSVTVNICTKENILILEGGAIRKEIFHKVRDGFLTASSNTLGIN